MKNTQSVFWDNLNRILVILFVIDVLVFFIPMLNMMAIVYTTFLYKRSTLQNKEFNLVLKVAYIISICITLYALLSMVYFMFTDFFDRVISFFIH